MHLLDAVHVLKLAGYETTRAVGDLRMDAFRAANMHCGECRRTRLRFAAFSHPDQVGYRGLAYCPECLHATEL